MRLFRTIGRASNIDVTLNQLRRGTVNTRRSPMPMADQTLEVPLAVFEVPFGENKVQAFAVGSKAAKGAKL